MPSRSMVRRAARAVGMTARPRRRLELASIGVAMASISGTTQVRPLGLDHRAQRHRVGHVDDVRAVRDLLAGRVGVAVDRDGLDAQALQRDQHLFAELAGAQQHHLGGAGRQRRTDPLRHRIDHDAGFRVADSHVSKANPCGPGDCTGRPCRSRIESGARARISPSAHVDSTNAISDRAEPNGSQDGR